MTKEELKNKLKISENTCIHCPTLELAIQVLNIFHQLGLKWSSGKQYITCTNWDSNKENTVYYPFTGEFSSLGFAQTMGYKIILNAEEFITLHTEMKKFDLENYVPKGKLEEFPEEIIYRMLEYQVEQGNKRDMSIFEKNKCTIAERGGFDWSKTKEGWDFWLNVIVCKNFIHFFELYPKQEYEELKNNKNMQENNKKEDNSQKFRVGDKVIDIILDLKGRITNVKSNGSLVIQFEGKSGITEYNLKIEKRPSLLHYRDDYDYSIINFNNLPKRKEPKRWRAEKDGMYNFVSFDNECWFFSDDTKDDYDHFDNDNYNSGNYFSTEVEAEIIAQKLNTYFKQLIQEEHEHERN